MGETTERELLDRIHDRYEVRSGNGPRYVCAEHVRNRAGFDANRTLDLMALDLWPSSGLAVHGFEVKTSRSDWLRELADPTKAGAFAPHLDYMWLVIADRALVKPGELPRSWGMLAPAGRGALMVCTQARRLRPKPTRDAPGEPLPRDLMAALARSISRTAQRRALAAAAT